MTTILVAEDNADARDVLTEILRAEGHVVLVAPDGQAALEMLEAFKPDIVVTDIDMPKLDGLTLCAKIKEDLDTATIPVILLSGQLPLYQPDVVFDVVQKPVLTEEFLASVNAAIRQLARSALSLP